MFSFFLVWTTGLYSGKLSFPTLVSSLRGLNRIGSDQLYRLCNKLQAFNHVWVERYTHFNEMTISFSICDNVICSVTENMFGWKWNQKSSSRGWYYQFCCNMRNIPLSYISDFCLLQLTGVLIGAVAAMFLIGISVLFFYRRYKLASMCHFCAPNRFFHTFIRV